MKKLATAAILALGVAVSTPAAATTWNFTGGGGLLGLDEVFTEGGDSVTATALNTQQPPAPQLHQSGGGLGVRTGNDNTNQLDNFLNDEAIVFDFGSVYEVSSIGVTAVGFNDDYRIYGTNNSAVLGCSSGGLSCISDISTLLLQDDNNGTQSIFGSFQYIIASGITGGFNDDFRISSLTAVAPVPLPAALPLLAGALGFLGLLGWRRKSAASAA